MSKDPLQQQDAIKYANPLLVGDADAGTDAVQEAQFEHELTDDQLGELTFAFQALDSDNSATIEPVELHAMVAILAGSDADVSLEDIERLFKETKAAFQAWLNGQDQDALLPSYMDRSQVQNQGKHGQTSTGVDRHHAELDVAKGNALERNPVLRTARRIGRHPLLKPLSATLNQTQRVLQLSYGLAKDATTGLVGLATSANGQLGARETLESLMLSPDHMIFAEYVYMMCSTEVLAKHIKSEDWRWQASSMRKFRHAFDTADVNGDNSLEFDELEMVLIAMDPKHQLSHEDITYLWKVMTQSEPGIEKSGDSINFVQYLHGLAKSRKDERTKSMLNLGVRNKFELLSLLIDTPVSKSEEEVLLNSLTGIEKMGIAMLKKDKLELDKEKTRLVLTKAGDGQLRRLDPEQKNKMKSLKTQMTALSGLIGCIFTIAPCWVENILCAEIGVDGVKNTYFNCDQLTYLDVQELNGTLEHKMNITGGVNLQEDLLLLSCKVTQNLGHWEGDTYFGYEYPTRYVDGPQSGCMRGKSWDPEASIADRCMACECMACSCLPHDDGKLVLDTGHPLLLWWVILGVVIVINVVFEIAFLMYYAVRFCVRVSWALDQRLVPLNGDRAFVADSLVRAAFELGNPVSPVMGVDPGAEPKSKMKLFLLVLAYKGKVVLTGMVIKALLGLVTPVHVSLWLKPWFGTMGGTILWDSLVSSCIMLQAQIRGFGVYTNAEVFNDILDEHFDDYQKISEEGHLQMVRCIGVSIVKNGCMYPTCELLLRHAIQYLHLRGKAAISNPGNLDNEDLLLDKMKKQEDGGELSDEERRVALSIYVLSCIMDGDMSSAQMELFARLCDVADDIAIFDKHRVRWLATRFRKFDMLTGEDVLRVFDPQGQGVDVPAAAKRAYFWYVSR